MGGLINTIKEYGLKLDEKMYKLFEKLPIREDYLVFESEGDLSDNSYALFNYLKENDYLKKYKVMWLLDDLSNAKEFENTIFEKKRTSKPSIRRNMFLARAKYYIYDHRNVLEEVGRRPETKAIYLSHGFGYKAGKGKPIDDPDKIFDKMICTGELAAEGLSAFWGTNINKTVPLGYSRMDYFFKNDPKVKEIINGQFHFDNYDKVILWMPTFRQTANKYISEDYIQNETGLPFFNTKNDLDNFNTFLKDNSLLFVLKLHHLQASLPIFSEKFSNILIVNDSQLKKLNVQLYQFIPLSDGLITDYSSISVDYMLLDKPIVYILDDLPQYQASRGIWPENVLDYMTGYQVYDIDALKSAIIDIKDGNDKYRELRNEKIGIFHTHKDGNTSKRIVEYLEL